MPVKATKIELKYKEFIQIVEYTHLINQTNFVFPGMATQFLFWFEILR